ncbi:hypothetical protein TorRG33x02_345630 [Trema orientale]|uniref:Reverse transcriptase domain-containing protein n=1 Tax=Trema orientale TaxID=63057 RepID=A0A2P5ANV7_TREOI|nr:hypothetical protein TorRG33x02_345630 [Trema orientale]
MAPKQNYTPLNTPREQIMIQIEGKNMLKAPLPMRAPPEKRNMNKYCRFHKELGHKTSECHHLKDQIEGLIQQGYLREYVNRAAKQDK